MNGPGFLKTAESYPTMRVGANNDVPSGGPYPTLRAEPENINRPDIIAAGRYPLPSVGLLPSVALPPYGSSPRKPS